MFNYFQGNRGVGGLELRIDCMLRGRRKVDYGVECESTSSELHF